MDLTCRCNPLTNYTCVACKVKRGDYRDWMLVEYPRVGASKEHKAIYWSGKRSA